MEAFVGRDSSIMQQIDKTTERRGLFIKKKKLMLNQADILYIESRAKKVEIHLLDAAESIEIYATMEELKERLGEDFYRCHRAYLVNMAHIAGYGNDSITIMNGNQVPMAKKRRKAFAEAYQNYLRLGGVFSV